MRCEEAGSLIMALLDNELADQERADVTVHLEGCPVCAALAADCRATATSADAWQVTAGEVADSVQRAIEREEQQSLIAEIRILRMEIDALRTEMAEIRRDFGPRPPAPLAAARRSFPYSDSQSPLPIV